MDGGNYIQEVQNSKKGTCIIFSPTVTQEAGALATSLKTFANHKVSNKID